MGFSLAAAALAPWAFVVALTKRALMVSTRTSIARPLYLIIAPVAVLLLLQRALATPVSDFSRERAIRNSAPHQPRDGPRATRA